MCRPIEAAYFDSWFNTCNLCINCYLFISYAELYFARSSSAKFIKKMCIATQIDHFEVRVEHTQLESPKLGLFKEHHNI